MAHLKTAIYFNQRSIRLLRVKTADPVFSLTLLNVVGQQFSKYTATSKKDVADLRDAEMNCQEVRTLAQKGRGSTELLDEIDGVANDIK